MDKNKGEGVDNGLTLDTVGNNWAVRLSGGEAKKTQIVSAIIKKPDILILDEIFTGLDPKSKVIIQRMLKKYLPNTLILVVDHEAHGNNYDSFYDQELYFSNQGITVNNIISKDYVERTVDRNESGS